MKAAKIFLLGMYVHFAASAAFPAAIFFACAGRGWNALGLGLLAAYLLEVAAVQLAGWCWLRRQRRGDQAAPGKLHYLWQVLPVADVLDTAVLLRRWPDLSVPSGAERTG